MTIIEEMFNGCELRRTMHSQESIATGLTIMAAATTGKIGRGIQYQADPQFSTKNMNISPERLHAKI